MVPLFAFFQRRNLQYPSQHGIRRGLREGAGHLISFAFAIHSCSKDSSFKGSFMMKIRMARPNMGLLTSASGRLQLRPASLDKSGHLACDPKNNLYISTGVAPIKCWRTRGPSGLNSHRRRGRRLQGSMRRISITCATTVKLISLSRRSRMRPCSKGTSLDGPQISPSLTHDASRGGGPE